MFIMEEQSLLPLNLPALYDKKCTLLPIIVTLIFFLFITTSFEMSEADMEKGADTQTLSAEIFENFWILTDYLL